MHDPVLKTFRAETIPASWASLTVCQALSRVSRASPDCLTGRASQLANHAGFTDGETEDKGQLSTWSRGSRFSPKSQNQHPSLLGPRQGSFCLVQRPHLAHCHLSPCALLIFRLSCVAK